MDARQSFKEVARHGDDPRARRANTRGVCERAVDGQLVLRRACCGIARTARTAQAAAPSGLRESQGS